MSSDPQRKKIVIVGGGTAGWMVAALLSKAFLKAGDKGPAITVLESQEVAPIGVGEATVHTMRGFLAACGVTEGKFMADTDATLKHGILFQDWLRLPVNGRRHRYFHPFEVPPALAEEGLVAHWLNATLKGETVERFDRWAGVQAALAAANRSPKSFQDMPFEALTPYGYHFDANKVAHHLKDLCLKRGVEHKLGHVVEVELASPQQISQLKLEEGEIISGDLFVDCTGFSRRLHAQLSPDWISYKDRLFVDRALTVRVPRNEPGYRPRPYTTATARQAGWTFEIDLMQRQGIGLVYASAHQSEEEAERELRSAYDLAEADLAMKRISFESGRVKHPWMGNCIALGLSQGFLEPLESTGLYFVEMGARLISDFLTFDPTARVVQDRYNSIMNELFDHSADFLVLHYILSKREDTSFWRSVKADTVLSDRLKMLLELWQTKLVSDADLFDGQKPFEALNHAFILYGMDRTPAELPELIEFLPVKNSIDLFETIRQAQASAVQGTVDHRDFIQKYAGAFG